MCAGPAAELGGHALACSPRPRTRRRPRSSRPRRSATTPTSRPSCAFARECDVVTFDHEHVPADVLDALVADGVPLHPTPGRAALRPGQARHARAAHRDRRRLPGAGRARARPTTSRPSRRRVGWPVVAKTPRGGYDGKGVRVIQLGRRASPTGSTRSGSAGALADGVLLEEQVDFVRELAVLVARSPSGQAAAWPVVETVQTDGICTEVLAPAPDLDPDLRGRGHRGRAADRRASSASPGCSPSRCSRCATPATGARGIRRQRAGHAPAQQRALVDGRRGDGPVRAAPARGARPAAGRTRAARAVDGDGQRPRR